MRFKSIFKFLKYGSHLLLRKSFTMITIFAFNTFDTIAFDSLSNNHDGFFGNRSCGIKCLGYLSYLMSINDNRMPAKCSKLICIILYICTHCFTTLAKPIAINKSNEIIKL